MDEQTFLTYIDQTEECWLWKRSKTPAGYGVFNRMNKVYYAHHQSWKLWKTTELPEVIRHKCRNRHCVNPDHLEGGTKKENNGIDRERDGTSNKGERHGLHKLTEANIIEMRQLRRDGTSLEELQKRYNIECHSTIMQALIGKTWSHVANPLTKEEMKELRHYKKSEITEDQQAEICRLVKLGVPKTKLGKDYGVSATTILNIVNKQLIKID